MISDDEIYDAFQPLWGDIFSAETYPAKRPLLAHYTSITTLDAIMANDQVWFSNPLFMNDSEELRFGILQGVEALRRHQEIRNACGSHERYTAFLAAFDSLFDSFANEHAFDVYAFCAAEHDPENTDGVLSMWRGYGGNGSGAAIIFDTSKLRYVDGVAPMIVSNVIYASSEQRVAWIANKLDEFATLLGEVHVETDKLYLPAFQLFERLKMFSLFSKHRGFAEEKEWRVVYLRERDREKKLDEMLHYAIGPRGLEPKLKLQIKPIDGVTAADLSLESIVSQIILGPTLSSPLAINSVKRMLEKNRKSELAKRLVGSTTPYRP
jgi:hypothetical protein